MYEHYYHLSERPFAATPDARLFVATPPASEAFGKLERCVRQARGIGILTGRAGIGKTHLLGRLAVELGEDFGVIQVPNAGFSSPRGLLQCLLAEFGESFSGLDETELRLRLTAATGEARAMTAGMVLLLDEGHRLSHALLEELRLLANFIDSGEPLFRIVVAGQLVLEERLTAQDAEDLNERIGEFVSLPSLSRDESRTYLETRLERASGSLEELFEPAAINALLEASDGIPRCLNQLADHALLLGSVAERASVSERLVREALDDLKRLPLQWCEPRPASEEAVEISEPFPSDGDFDDVVEIGSLAPEGNQAPPAAPDDEFAEMDARHDRDDDVEVAADLDASDDAVFKEPPEIVSEPEPALPAALESVPDRFARLDAQAAEQRWLDHWEHFGEEHFGDGAPAPPEDRVSQALCPSSSEPPGARLLESPSRSDMSARGKTTGQTSEPSPDVPPSRVRESREQIHSASHWQGKPKSATLFRDLRRRQGLG